MRRLHHEARKFSAALRERLVAFAEHELKLGAPLPDGHTRREHLERAAKQTGRRSAELDGPPCPESHLYLWHWFLSLSHRRASGAAGIEPVSWPQIEAFFRVQGVQPTAYEIECLDALEGAWFRTRPKPKKT